MKRSGQVQPYRILESRRVYSGKIVGLEVDKIEVAGEARLREVVRHPGGVVVLGQLPDGRIPFVRQHRYPMNRQLLELPAGKIDPGEEPKRAAAREMEEETGYRAEQLRRIFSFYPTPGFCDELLHFYYAPRLARGRGDLEEDEGIKLEFYTLAEALRMAKEGRIEDGKTLLGLYWLNDWQLRSQGIEEGS